METDYIVIGGGICGHEIGALLSTRGRVLVLEKNSHAGGRAMVKEINRFKFDFGPHPVRFGPDSPLAQTLSDVGRPVEFIKPGKFWACMKDGSRQLFPAGGIGAVLKSKMVPFFKTLKMLLEVKRMDASKIRRYFGVSIADWLDEEGFVPDIRRYVHMAASAILVCPFLDQGSAGELIDAFQQTLKVGSVYYPRGGWEAIFSRLRGAIEANGEVQTGAEVTDLILDGSRVTGVKIGAVEHHATKAVVCTVPLQHVDSFLGEHLDADKREYFQNLVPTSGICLDYGLSRPVTDLTGILFFERTLGFGFCPSNLSPEVVPAGKSWMSFLRVTRRDDLADPARRDQLLDEFEADILAHFPEIKAATEERRVMHLKMVDGVQVNTYQHREVRQNYTLPGLDGFFLCGDSVGGHGSGGDVGHTSVRACFNQIP